MSAQSMLASFAAGNIIFRKHFGFRKMANLDDDPAKIGMGYII
jgi:hypothetical protein